MRRKAGLNSASHFPSESLPNLFAKFNLRLLIQSLRGDGKTPGYVRLKWFSPQIRYQLYIAERVAHKYKGRIGLHAAPVVTPSFEGT